MLSLTRSFLLTLALAASIAGLAAFVPLTAAPQTGAVSAAGSAGPKRPVDDFLRLSAGYGRGGPTVVIENSSDTTLEDCWLVLNGEQFANARPVTIEAFGALEYALLHFQDESGRLTPVEVEDVVLDCGKPRIVVTLEAQN